MIGTILNDRYEILEKIDEDDVIEVYKARCNKLNRYNTIKILKKNCMDDYSVVERFKHEAAELAKLTNSNIVNIYDVVYQGNINYMVMEYVIGKTLKELIIENVRLSFERSLNIAIQIAKALDSAHKSNIVHGNIRPENILITDSGTVKVANFSLLKSDKHLDKTNFHKLAGMMPYCSPEQLGNSTIDTRTDIYSLGIVMYEMLTGKLPFKDENPIILKNKIQEDLATEPIQLNNSIPVILNNIIMKCIEKEPNGRYKNANEILLELQSIQNNMDYEVLSNPVKKDFTQRMPAINIPKKEINDIKSTVVTNVNKSKLTHKTKSYLVYTLIGIMVFVVGISVTMSFSGFIENDKHKEQAKATNKVIVPNLTNRSKEDAKKAIEAIGLKYKEVIENTNEAEEGMVIGTNPGKGATVKKGDTIEVRVSSGVIKKKVPNLIGKYESEARVIVPQNGFKIGKPIYIRDDRYVKYHVVDQEPKPGEELEEGGVITYTVNLQ